MLVVMLRAVFFVSTPPLARSAGTGHADASVGGILMIGAVVLEAR